LILKLFSELLYAGLFLDFGIEFDIEIPSPLSNFVNWVCLGVSSSGSLESDSSRVIGILICGFISSG
jgi:hypothetical protein